VACGVLVQPQTFAVPLPPQLWGDVQVPQTCMPPQPFGTEPHFPMHAVALTVGTHSQVVGEPWHASLLAHAVHRAASAQPLLASVVTHLPLQFLVPAPQLPSTHAPAWHTTVPAPTAGQAVASHDVAPQPYVGSDTATHLPSHFLYPEGQLPMTQAPCWHAKVAPVAWLGHVEASQLSAPHPNAGSVTDTQAAAHFLFPAPHSAMTHSPASHASMAPAASGHRDALQSVGSQPYAGSLIATHEPSHSFLSAGHSVGISPPPASPPSPL
jgi:hypothetical protein